MTNLQTLVARAAVDETLLNGLVSGSDETAALGQIDITALRAFSERLNNVRFAAMEHKDGP